MPIDIFAIAKQQANSDEDLSEYKEFDVGAQDIKLHCKTNQPNPRPVVRPQLLRKIHDTFHNFSHPDWKATCRLVRSRYFWPTLKQNIKKWASECLACQAAKINRHMKRPLGKLPCPTKRFTQCILTWLVLYRIIKAPT